VTEDTTPTVEAAPATPNRVLAVHTVQSGDTLGGIAKKYYGKFSLHTAIEDANAELLGGRNALSLGMKLKIPVVVD